MTVTIKTAEEQDKMRVAGRLAADVLDMIGDHVKPGVTTDELERHLPRLHHRGAGRDPGPAELPRLSEIDLHLRQSCGLPRHPRRPQAEDRRRRQYRHHRHQGRLPRRHQPHVLRRQARRPGATPAEIAFEGMWLGIEELAPASTWAMSAQPSRNTSRRTASPSCGSTAATASAGFFTKTRRFCTTAARHRHGTAGRHDPDRRTDGQCRQSQREAAARRLDRRHQGPQPVRAVGAHCADYRNRLRSADARCRRIAERPLSMADTLQPRPTPSCQQELPTIPGRRVRRRRWSTNAPRLVDALSRRSVAAHMRDCPSDVGPGRRRRLRPRRTASLLRRRHHDAAAGRSPTSGSRCRRFITSLWDVGLEIGHSVRTVAQCVEQAQPT